MRSPLSPLCPACRLHLIRLPLGLLLISLESELGHQVRHDLSLDTFSYVLQEGLSEALLGNEPQLPGKHVSREHLDELRLYDCFEDDLP
jgi:hypothetical protein